MTADVTTIATDLQFPEGPIAMADGSILLVEIKRGSLTWLEADGSVRAASTSAAARTAPPSGPTARSTSATTAGASTGRT